MASTVFQGGQSMPAVGTAGYAQVQAGTYNGGSTATPAQGGNSAGAGGATFVPTPSGGASAPVNNYSVVTAGAANNNWNATTTDWNNNIKPAVTNATAVTANNNALANQTPVVNGYNVGTVKTGAPGEITMQPNAQGQTYYANTATPTLTASDVQGMISGTDTSTNASTGTTGAGGAAPMTPVQTAQAQTGINPTTENATYQANVQGETDVITSGAQAFQNALNISASSIPFTPAQQTLIDSTNQAFQQMTTNAQVRQAALSSQFGDIGDNISQKTGQLIGIATDQAAAIAKMEVGFQTENYNEKYQTVTAAYAAFKDAETAKMTALTNIHSAVMTQYANAVAAAQAQQTFNQTVYKDAASLAQSNTEFRDKLDAMGTKIGTDVYDKTTGKLLASHYDSGQTNPQTGVTTPIVTAGADGTVDTNSQAAYLATLPPQYQALVQGIANGKIEPPSARTAQGAKILAMVAQYDPTLKDGSGGFDATKYQARLTMQRGLASTGPTSLGGAMKVANTVIAHLKSFLDTSSKLTKNSQFTGINTLETGVLGNIKAGVFGDTSMQSNQAQATTISKGLTDEMTKFFKGTGSTDVASIKDWGTSLNPNAPTGTLSGNVQGGLTLFSGQFNTFLQQYKDVMGKDANISQILQPETVATLSAFKNQGYQVDVPGVYYTDKAAYLSNGGSQESLTSAYSALQAAGIPTTPDNILQAAQII